MGLRRLSGVCEAYAGGAGWSETHARVHVCVPVHRFRAVTAVRSGSFVNPAVAKLYVGVVTAVRV